MRSGKCEGYIHFTEVLSSDPKVMILVKEGGKEPKVMILGGTRGLEVHNPPRSPAEVPRGWTLGDTLGSYPRVCASKNV